MSDGAQGLHPERGHRTSSAAPPRRRRARRSRRWCATSRRPRRSSRPTRTCRRSCRRSGGGGARRPRTRGASSSGSSRATKRKLDADEVSRQLTPKLSRVPGIRVFFTNPPPINIGGRSVEEPVPVHAAGDRHRRALRQPNELEATLADLPQLQRRDQRPADQEPAGRRRRSTATAPPSLGVTRAADRAGALQRVRRRPGLHHLHRQQPVLGGHGAAARVPARPRRAAAALRARAPNGTLVPLGGGRDGHARPCGPLSVNHSGQIPAVTHLVQPRAGRRARRRRSKAVERAAARDAAPSVTTSFSGTAQAFAGRAAGPAAAARPRDLGHLPRARHPLRELHPPAHHPLRAAVRRASARC